MSSMHYQNSTTYFHRACIQSGIVWKKLGFEARCYIIVIYLNVGYNIAINDLGDRPWTLRFGALRSANRAGDCC
jgi:hypothetical protein